MNRDRNKLKEGKIIYFGMKDKPKKNRKTKLGNYKEKNDKERERRRLFLSAFKTSLFLIVSLRV